MKVTRWLVKNSGRPFWLVKWVAQEYKFTSKDLVSDVNEDHLREVVLATLVDKPSGPRAHQNI